MVARYVHNNSVTSDHCIFACFNVYLFIFLSKSLPPTFVKRCARNFLTRCGLGPIEALLYTDYKCGNPQTLPVFMLSRNTAAYAPSFRNGQNNIGGDYYSRQSAVTKLGVGHKLRRRSTPWFGLRIGASSDCYTIV